MIVPEFVRGGAERRMAATAAGLANRGYDLRIVASRPLEPSENDFERDLKALGLETHVAPSDPPKDPSEISELVEAELAGAEADLPSWWVMAMARSFGRAILEFSPEVVHGWIDRWAVVAGLVSCSLGVPKIVVGQTSTTPERRNYADADLLRDGYRALSRNQNVVMVNVSRRCAIEHEEWLGFERGRISTIYTSVMPGVVCVPSEEKVKTYRQQLGTSPGTQIVGTIMRLEEPKDPDLWVDTAQLIVKAKPNVRFLIGGSGSRKESILQRIDALGLRCFISLSGPIVDVGLTYAALDVFLLTSSAEGLPNTVIEAQAAGRPVVSVDVGGIPEAIIDGTTGLIVKERSATALATAVLAILEDPDWRVRATTTGPAFVAQRFGYGRMIDETIALYEGTGTGQASWGCNGLFGM